MPVFLCEEPPFPKELSYIWKSYFKLDNYEPLTNVELKAWVDLNDFELSSWEIDLIKQIDRTYWRIRND